MIDGSARRVHQIDTAVYGRAIHVLRLETREDAVCSIIIGHRIDVPRCGDDQREGEGVFLIFS